MDLREGDGSGEALQLETHPPLSHDASCQEPELEPSIWREPPSPMTVISYDVPAVIVVAMIKWMMRRAVFRFTSKQCDNSKELMQILYCTAYPDGICCRPRAPGRTPGGCCWCRRPMR